MYSAGEGILKSRSLRIKEQRSSTHGITPVSRSAAFLRPILFRSHSFRPISPAARFRTLRTCCPTQKTTRMIAPTGGSMCPDSDKLAAADNWLKANLDPLITNPALANSVFIVLFDEALDTDSTNGGGRVARGSGRSPCQAGIHVHHVLPAPEHVATDAGTALSSRQARTLGDSSGDGGVLSVENRSHSQPFWS